MKFHWNQGPWVTWGGPDRDWYYFGISWNEPKAWVYQGRLWSSRRLGLEHDYYDGPHAQLCLWFFNICWSTRWTKCVL